MTITAEEIAPTPMPQSALPIVITMGDAAGIGAEIIAKAYAEHPSAMAGTIVLGDVLCMRRAVEVCGLSLNVALVGHDLNDLTIEKETVPVLQVDWAEDVFNEPNPPLFGVVSKAAGAYSAKCVQQAAQMVLRKKAAAMVTAPIHKEAWAAAHIPFPGHTEMLQHEAAEHSGQTIAQMPVRMMLAASHLRVVLVTVHMGLRDALDALSTDLILQTIRIADASLTSMLGRRPQLAVSGVNPHAGEGGLFGHEEAAIIQPAVDAARVLGISVSDPQPPDTVFMQASTARGQQAKYDAVIAMYHDQGLIPVKYLGTDDGVNVTLGLSLVRTSPDHGTAFDIAGTGQASAESLLLAVKQAKQLSVNPPNQ